MQPRKLSRVLERLKARLIALLEVCDRVRDFVRLVLELGPEEAGEDFGMEGGLEEAFGAHVVLGGAEGVQACGGDFFGAGVEFLGAADGAVEAAGVLDVFDHYFAALEAGFAEAGFEEFENFDLGVVSWEDTQICVDLPRGQNLRHS